MELIKKNQTGATMVEALGVLTIVSMLGVSVISLIGNIFDMFNQAVIVNQVRELQKSISDRYKFEGNYSMLFEGRDTEAVASFLCEEKMAPFQMCQNGRLRHKGGGDVWIMPVIVDEEGTPDYGKYSMEFWGLSNKICVSIAQINWWTQKKSDIYKMVINYGQGNRQLVVNMPSVVEEGAENFPVSANSVIKACSNDDNNDIMWIFY